MGAHCDEAATILNHLAQTRTAGHGQRLGHASDSRKLQWPARPSIQGCRRGVLFTIQDRALMMEVLLVETTNHIHCSSTSYLAQGTRPKDKRRSLPSPLNLSSCPFVFNISLH